MLTKLKVIAGKQTCDRCQKKNPPIQECSWETAPNSHRNIYMDLCSSCIVAIEGVFADGGWIGPYGDPEAPSSRSTPRQNAKTERTVAP